MGFPHLWMGSPPFPARVNSPDRQSKHQQAHPQPQGSQLLIEFIITQKIQTAAVEIPTLVSILLSKCTSSAAHPAMPCLIPFFCHGLCFMGKHENSFSCSPRNSSNCSKNENKPLIFESELFHPLGLAAVPAASFKCLILFSYPMGKLE